MSKGDRMNEKTDDVKKQVPGEDAAVMSIREIYEARIADIKASTTEHLSSLKKDKGLLALTVCVLGLFLMLLILVDLLIGNMGWIRY